MKREDKGTAVPNSTTNATIGDLKVSEDGQVMILGLDQGGIRSLISQDGGLNWTDLHSNGELSGTGTIRKNPDIFIRNAPNNLDNFVSIQNKILDNSAKILKKNGLIMYVTCSLQKILSGSSCHK